VAHQSNDDVRELAALGHRIQRSIIQESRRAGVGHIGSALCIADVLAVLFGDVLAGEPDDPDRDRFILSKGHAALALYAALSCRGRLSEAELARFCTDGTALGAHPEHLVPGIDFSTGSLGQGPSLAAGAALAARLQGSDRRTFALISDAELNEGSVWEAAMFAAHHRLGRLTLILDANGQQALGYTSEVLSLEPVGDRFRAFGWDVEEVDGHDPGALQALLGAPSRMHDLPRLIVARTTFGKGVSFMENRIEWHYLPLDDDQCQRALSELEVMAAVNG
jgi:transketolase